MDVDWNAELRDRAGRQWSTALRPRLEGLTDHEYFWEPVPGAWSVRPRAEAASALAAGGGELVIDFAYPRRSRRR